MKITLISLLSISLVANSFFFKYNLSLKSAIDSLKQEIKVSGLSIRKKAGGYIIGLKEMF